MPKRIISTALIAMAVIPAAAQEPLVFGEPVEIDSVPKRSAFSNIQLAYDSPIHWIVGWEGSIGGRGLGFDHDLLLSHTLDGGLTWSAPAPLNNDAPSDEFHDDSLQITPNNDGSWVAAWLRHGAGQGFPDLVIARSQDGGVTWSDPQLLVESVLDSTPEFAADGDGTIMLLWGRREYSASVDGGESWSAPAAVAGGDGVLDDIGCLIAAGTDSFLIFAVKDDGLVVARTSDTGRSWSPAVSLGSAERGARPAAAYDGAGNVVAVWTAENSGPGERDLVTSRSSDGGVTWSEAEPFGPNSQAIASDSRHETIQIVTDSTDWLALWRTAQWEVFFSTSRDAGQTWTQALEFEPPLEADGPFDLMGGRDVAFALAHSHFKFASPSTFNVVFVSSEFDRDRGWQKTIALMDDISVDQPDVAAGHNARWTAVWRRTRFENEIELYAAQSTDLGATWNEPRLVFRTTDRYVRTPRIVAGGEGHWAVVFQSAASEQSDGELLIAHSVDDAATWSEAVRFDNEMLVDQRLRGTMEVTVNTSGEWLATWTNRERGNLASVSRDEGRGWSAPHALPPIVGSRNVEVAAMPDGRWLIAWSDSGIHLAVSSDGATWSELPPVRHEEGAELWAPTLSVDLNGHLLLCYWQIDYEITSGPEAGLIFLGRHARRSLDGGLTWTPARQLFTVMSHNSARTRHAQNLGPDDWLVLVGPGRWLRSTEGGEWMVVDRPSGSFDRVAADGLGNFIAVQVDSTLEALSMNAVHFGLAGADDSVADDSGADSQDAAGPPAPGFPCPLAAVVLLAVGPVILLAVRRGKAH